MKLLDALTTAPAFSNEPDRCTYAVSNSHLLDDVHRYVTLDKKLNFLLANARDKVHIDLVRCRYTCDFPTHIDEHVVRMFVFHNPLKGLETPFIATDEDNTRSDWFVIQIERSDW